MNIGNNISKDKIMYFKDDDEFFLFVVNPVLIIKRDPLGILYHTWDYTDSYKNAIADGMYFKILDPNSRIKYRTNITYQFVPKKIQNVLC